MINLRTVQPKDKDKIREWRNLPEVARYMYTNHYITPKEHDRWFQRILRDPKCRHWIIVCDGVDVGLVNIYNLDQRNRSCHWAFYVANSYARGKGVGSFVEHFVLHYVFDELGFNKLCCEVLDFNMTVVNMHKSFGFKQEGFYREHIRKGGQFHNVIALAILRKEWVSKKTKIEERLRKKGFLSIYEKRD